MNFSDRHYLSRFADFGRFIAASFIFYYHVGITAGYPLSEFGEYAVSFFIILSGIAYVCFSSDLPTDARSYGRYISHRLGSVFPTFVAMNGLIFLASYVHPSASGTAFTIADFLLSASGLSQYVGRRFLSTVMWFVPFIVQAYFLFPLIDRLLKRVNAAAIIVFAFLLSSLLTVWVFSSWSASAVEICRNWSPIFRLPEVCIGIVLGREIRSSFNGKPQWSSVLVFSLFAIGLKVLGTQLMPGANYISAMPFNGLLVTATVFALAVFAPAIFPSKGKMKFLRLIGAASYPFYLVHGVAILFIYKRFGSAPKWWLLYFLACWAGAVIYTVLARKLDEFLARRHSAKQAIRQ